MKWWGRRKMLQAGARASHFRLRDLDGNARPLDEILAGGPALFVFYKVSCPVCQFALPYVERMYRQAAKDTIQFFGVSQDNAGATRNFCLECGITFPSLLDEKGSGYPASNVFGISRVPTSFLVEEDGTISMVLESFCKSEFETLGRRLDAAPFLPGEYVPDWRPG